MTNSTPFLSNDKRDKMIYDVVNDIRKKAINSDPDFRQQKTNFKLALDKLNDSIIDLKHVMLENWVGLELKDLTD
jgi:hypothetical protein